MEFDSKQLADTCILEAKIKGETVIAIVRLVLLLPLLVIALLVAFQDIPRYGVSVAFSSSTFWIEILFLVLAGAVSLFTLRKMRRKQYANWMTYALPLVDVTLITLTVSIVANPGSGLMFTGAPPWLYFIFIILCVLRYSPAAVVITGIASAVAQLVLSFISLTALHILDPVPQSDTFLHAVTKAPILIQLDDVFFKPFIMLIVTGLAAYIAQRFNKMVHEQVEIRIDKDRLRLTLSNELKTVTDTIGTISDSLVTNSDQFSTSVGTMVQACDKIEHAINEETTAVEETSATITEMIRSIESVAHNISQQANLVTTSVTAIEEIGASINHITQTSKKANGLANSLLSNAEDGERIMEEVSGAIQETERASKRIEEIVEIISSIAGETDLLAMNAAIEAAHAGDAGKGFAIVADEIRNLAETSGNNAKMINDILKDLSVRILKIVELVSSAMTALVNILKDARETSRINHEVLNAMEEESGAVGEIVRTTQELSKITEEVKNASIEQAAGGSQIISVITHIKQQTDDVSELTKNQIQKSDEIAAVTKELNEIVLKNRAIISTLDTLVKKL